MTFFESLLALLAIAILLLQVSRRLTIPYPTMLAAAGVVIGLVPGAPRIVLDPHTALALFIAPVLVDAAYDFPVGTVRRLWRPLFALAVLAVLLSAGAVAWLGVVLAGLPLYAALALGAIVAPPDAAAATAVLRSVSMPRRSVDVLKGESLLNDATALLLFSAAISFPSHGGIDGWLALELGVAAPGGILLGIVLAKLLRSVMPFVTGTLGGNLFEFVGAIGVWILAERLDLSAVLCLVAFAMTIARTANVTIRPRVRIHSFAVWGTAVFLLNVLAFLLMGLQARIDHRRDDARPVARGGLVRRRRGRDPDRRADGVGGRLQPPCLSPPLAALRGQAGIITQRSAHRLVRDARAGDAGDRLRASRRFSAARHDRAHCLCGRVRDAGGPGPDPRSARPPPQARRRGRACDGAGRGARRSRHGRACDTGGQERPASRITGAIHSRPHARPQPPAIPLRCEEKRRLGLAAIRRQRKRLEELRNEQRVGPDAYVILQEDLDFAEVALTSESERRIEEG